MRMGMYRVAIIDGIAQQWRAPGDLQIPLGRIQFAKRVL